MAVLLDPPLVVSRARIARSPMDFDAPQQIDPVARPAGKVWVQLDGELLGSVALVAQRTLFGRGDHCDVRLDDPTVSTDHLEITRHGEALIANDLFSRNGTLLNGQPLDKATRLKNGDVLVLGKARLNVTIKTLSATTVVLAPNAFKLSDEDREIAAALVAQFRERNPVAARPATRAEIADQLHMSERTVQRRLDGLAKKLKIPEHSGRERSRLLARTILELGLDVQR